jgi:hypothetical protein
MLQLVGPAELNLFALPRDSVCHRVMSHKRKASTVLQQQDQQHPAKKPALCTEPQDGTVLMAMDSGCIIPNGVMQQQATCSSAVDLDVQHEQQQQEQQQGQEQQRQQQQLGDLDTQVIL